MRAGRCFALTVSAPVVSNVAQGFGLLGPPLLSAVVLRSHGLLLATSAFSQPRRVCHRPLRNERTRPSQSSGSPCTSYSALKRISGAAVATWSGATRPELWIFVLAGSSLTLVEFEQTVHRLRAVMARRRRVRRAVESRVLSSEATRARVVREPPRQWNAHIRRVLRTSTAHCRASKSNID